MAGGAVGVPPSEPRAPSAVPVHQEVVMPLPPLVEPAAELSSEEVRRYSRHLIIPDVGMLGQRRLKNAKVLVVGGGGLGDRKSTRLNSSHVAISYAVFCLNKKISIITRLHRDQS